MRAIIIVAFALLVSNGLAQTTITISNSSQTKISKHIYGHFSEHLGRCVYDGFYVGEKNTTIPHKNGVRLDVVDALKKLKIPNLRWPGGCFADTYHWKDGIGAKEKRPTMVNTWWGGVTENNSFGTHDFLDMCELLDTEPYLSVNVGSGTVQEVAEWIQYTTFDGVSPMSDLRKVNGREKPWKVTYWGVGNEAWGCGGNMTAEYYANIYRQYATFMAGGSNKVFKIASGASGSDYHWTEVLMRDVPHHLLDGVALHHYSVINWSKKGASTAFSEREYFLTLKQALLMEELVTRHSAIMDKYDPEKKIALVVDEWGGWYDVEPNTNPGFLYQQNTIRDALLAGVTLNIFNNHSDRVRMANLAQVVNVLQAVILTDGAKMILTPTYHVMEMYQVHQEATLLPLKVTTGEYEFNADKLPAISASASMDNTGLTNISITNIHTSKTEEVIIELPQKATSLTGRIITSNKIQDYNSFDKPETIKPVVFKDASVKGNRLTVKMPPHSVVVVQVK